MVNSNINFKKAKKRIDDYLGDTDHLVISGWMINKLNLSGAKLQIFAIIHSYSKGKNGYFYGSQMYLARWANTCKSNVNEILKDLVKVGLIHKYDESTTGYKQVVYYTSNVDSDSLIEGKESLDLYKNKYGNNKLEEKPVVKEDRYKKSTSIDQKVDTPCPESEHNNINIINENIVSTSTIQEKLNNFFDEKIEIKGMLVSPKQASDINELVRIIGRNELNSSKDDLFNFLEKIYNKEKKDFYMDNGSRVKNLKAFVISAFKNRTEYLKQESIAIKKLADEGDPWASDYVEKHPNEFNEKGEKNNDSDY